VFLGLDGEHERSVVTVGGVRFHLGEFSFLYPCERPESWQSREASR
jgi:hypothetical protein